MLIQISEGIISLGADVAIRRLLIPQEILSASISAINKTFPQIGVQSEMDLHSNKFITCR